MRREGGKEGGRDGGRMERKAVKSHKKAVMIEHWTYGIYYFIIIRF